MSQDSKLSSLEEFNNILKTETGVEPELFWQRVREHDPGRDLELMDRIDRLSVSEIVGRAFLWAGTPEGHNFWERVSERTTP